MTNFEFWKDEINKIIAKSQDISVVKNKPMICAETDCVDCKFYNRCSNRTIIEWLYTEHIEQPAITPKERKLLEVLESGYIARDEGSTELLYWYSAKPGRDRHGWTNEDGKSTYFDITKCPGIYLEFIKWEDEEPWAVEELLKLEVRE